MKCILCLFVVLPFVPAGVTAAEPQRLDRLGDPLPQGAITRIGTNRFRHGMNVLTVVYSPDGKTIASGGEDKVVRVWESRTGKQLQTFVGHRKSIREILYAADGKRIISSSNDETLRYWEIATGKELSRRKLDVFSSYVAFSPDRKVLALTGNNGKVRILEAESGKESRGWDAELRAAVAIAFSPDGNTLVVGGCGNAGSQPTVSLWDWRTTRLVRSIKWTTSSKEAWVSRLAYSPDGKILATMSGGFHEKMTLQIWETANGRKIAGLNPARDFRANPVFSPDSKLLAVCDGDGIYVWEVATRKLVRSTKICQGQACTLAFSPDCKTLVSGHQFGRVCMWEPTGNSASKPVGDFECDEISWAPTSISPEGRTLATIREDGNARIWELKTGKPGPVLKKAEKGKLGRTCSVVFSPDGKFVAAAHKGGTIIIWDRAAGAEIRRIKEHKGPVTVTFAADGTLVSSGEDKLLCFWDTGTGKKIRQITGREMGLLSPDMTTIASISTGTFLCEAATGTALHSWKNPMIKDLPGFGPDTVAFSPEGMLLATVGYQWARVSDTISGQELFAVTNMLSGGDNSYHGVAFSPDGRILAVGFGPKVLLWDISTGKPLHSLENDRGMVFSVAFTGDGKYLVSCYNDGTALVWDVGDFTRHQPEKLSAKRLSSLWDELRGQPQPAYKAFLTMADDPGQTVCFLSKQLRPATKWESVNRLIAALNGTQFAAREKAAAELEMLGLQSEPSLRGALSGKLSLEVRKRLEGLLQRIESSPDTRQTRRAIKLLRRVNTLEAQKLLEALASGEACSILTRDANAALNRVWSK